MSEDGNIYSEKISENLNSTNIDIDMTNEENMIPTSCSQFCYENLTTPNPGKNPSCEIDQVSFGRKYVDGEKTCRFLIVTKYVRACTCLSSLCF